MLKPVQRIPSYRLLLIGELDFRGFVAFVADSVVMRGGSVFLPNFSQLFRQKSRALLRQYRQLRRLVVMVKFNC